MEHNREDYENGTSSPNSGDSSDDGSSYDYTQNISSGPVSGSGPGNTGVMSHVCLYLGVDSEEIARSLLMARNYSGWKPLLWLSNGAGGSRFTYLFLSKLMCTCVVVSLSLQLLLPLFPSPSVTLSLAYASFSSREIKFLMVFAFGASNALSV